MQGIGIWHRPERQPLQLFRVQRNGRILVKTLKEEFTLDSLSENLSFDKETMKVRVCKSCGGLGSINYGVEEHECEDCHGTGRIIEQKILTEYQLHHVDGIAAAEEKA